MQRSRTPRRGTALLPGLFGEATYGVFAWARIATTLALAPQRRTTWWVPQWLSLGLCAALLSTGCTTDVLHQRYALFPPQQVIEDGDYATFRTANMQRAEQCAETDTDCAVALFNLGFIAAYPPSPYYSPSQALRYFGELGQKFPQTPWAAQGQAWMALFKEQHALFPPQGIMTKEDYQRFRAENLQVVQHCTAAARCDAALFNLGFVHAYPASPYHNRSEALRYFEELGQKFPRTPWATQGNIWITLLKAQYALEQKQRRLQTELRSKEQAMRQQEATMRTHETALQRRDATIRTLQEQLDRARRIDAEIDKKERELFR